MGIIDFDYNPSPKDILMGKAVHAYTRQLVTGLPKEFIRDSKESYLSTMDFPMDGEPAIRSLRFWSYDDYGRTDIELNLREIYENVHQSISPNGALIFAHVGREISFFPDGLTNGNIKYWYPLRKKQREAYLEHLRQRGLDRFPGRNAFSEQLNPTKLVDLALHVLIHFGKCYPDLVPTVPIMDYMAMHLRDLEDEEDLSYGDF